MDEVRNLVNKCDIFAIQETWLPPGQKSTTLDTVLTVPIENVIKRQNEVQVVQL